MAKPEWGTKRTCFSCSARFYDLRREPIVCPVCGTVHDPARAPKPKRGSPIMRDEPVLVPELVDEEADRTVDEDVLDDEADADDDAGDASGDGDLADLSSEDAAIMEDTSELGEDNDDIGEVMEHIDDELDEKP